MGHIVDSRTGDQSWGQNPEVTKVSQENLDPGMAVQACNSSYSRMINRRIPSPRPARTTKRVQGQSGLIERPYCKIKINGLGM